VYSAALWVTDQKGNRDVDFCRIKVHRTADPQMLPTVVITHFPTRPKAGETVMFRIWVQTEETKEKLRVDFGDGAGLSDYSSWQEVTHAYRTAGMYIVRVETSVEGAPITEQTRVVIEPA
jgi:hypothetical protein